MDSQVHKTFAQKVISGTIGALCCLPFSIMATSLLVNVPGDTDPGSVNGGIFAGNAGDLRGVLNHVNLVPDTYDITFNLGASNTIQLSAMLPLINLVNTQPVTIDGDNQGTHIVIDGGSQWRGLFAVQGDVTCKNMTVQNVVSRGGKGGGGGMGAGAGIFVDAAHVTLSNISINNATVIGGDGGGFPAANTGYTAGGGGLGAGNAGSDGGGQIVISGGQLGGGGGIGGNGGTANGSGGGSGGGGINTGTNHLGTGASVAAAAGFTGGGIGGSSAGAGSPGGGAGGPSGGGGGAAASNAGGGGGGGVGGSAPIVGNGGVGGYGGGGGSGLVSLNGGKGGFGGGGGGAASSGVVVTAGAGGFGGGGGSLDSVGNNSKPGIGGFGGGGGGGKSNGAAIAAGGVGGGQGGGDAFTTSFGGGGAGFGGALFVNTGSLTIQGFFSTDESNSAMGGIASGGLAVSGWAAGKDCFFVTSANPIVFDPQDSTITITNSIADDSAASFVGVPAGVTSGTATGASITIGSSQNVLGTVLFPTSNQSTYSGPTVVQNGIFRLDGSIMSPVTILQGGKFQGTGIVHQSVTVNGGGRIHAGNSIGTLTMDSLSLNNQSILELDIDLSTGSNLSSVYQVNGPVSLNNATLQINALNPESGKTNHTYSFLFSSGGITGTFGQILALPGYRVELLQTSTSLTLLVKSGLRCTGIPLTKNQQSLLCYLLQLTEVPSLQPILDDLSSLTLNQLRAALDSISPARNAAASYFANQSAFAMERIPLDRLKDRRILDSRRKQKNLSLADVITTKSEDFLALNDSRILVDRTKNDSEKLENGSFWAAGFGNLLSQNGMHSNPKIQDTATGAVVGFDYNCYQNGIVTISAGYLHNDITEGHESGSGTSNGAVLSAYGTGYIQNGYIELGMFGGYNHFNMKRNVVIGDPELFSETSRSSFNNWVAMPHLGGGFDWMMDWGVIEPFASLDWAVSFQQTYNEKAASPLNAHIKSQTPSILRSQVGCNLYETWERGSSMFLFQQSVSYVNKALFQTKMHSTMLFSPSSAPAGVPSSFTLQTYNRTLNLAAVGAEIFYKHKRSGFFLAGTYQGEFGSGYISNDFIGTVGVFF